MNVFLIKIDFKPSISVDLKEVEGDDARVSL